MNATHVAGLGNAVDVATYRAKYSRRRHRVRLCNSGSEALGLVSCWWVEDAAIASTAPHPTIKESS